MQFLKSPESCSYSGDGTLQSQVGTIAVTSDYLPSPHQVVPQLRSEMGDHAHTFIELSHPPTPPSLETFTNFSCKPIGCHLDSFPRPPSLRSIDPLDCTVLFSSIPNSSPVVNEDQVVNRVGVM